jgi:hypothetical protein
VLGELLCYLGLCHCRWQRRIVPAMAMLATPMPPLTLVAPGPTLCVRYRRVCAPPLPFGGWGAPLWRVAVPCAVSLRVLPAPTDGRRCAH